MCFQKIICKFEFKEIVWLLICDLFYKSCGCGRSLALHSQIVKHDYDLNVKNKLISPQKWNYKEHTCKDGFADHGVLKFVDSNQHLAKVGLKKGLFLNIKLKTFIF